MLPTQKKRETLRDKWDIDWCSTYIKISERPKLRWPQKTTKIQQVLTTTPAGSRRWCVHASGCVFQWCLPPQPFLEAYCTRNFRCSFEGSNPLNYPEIPSTVVKFYQKKDRSKDVFPSIADPKIIYMYHLLSVFFFKPFQTCTHHYDLCLHLRIFQLRNPGHVFDDGFFFCLGLRMVAVGATSAAAHSCGQDATVAPNSAGKRS